MYPQRLYSLLILAIVFHIAGCEPPIVPDPDVTPKLVTGTVTDIEGKVYSTVKIGEQWWMSENLSVKFYNDSTPMDLVTDDEDWRKMTSGAYCWYMNDFDLYGVHYGALYNWHALSTGKLCPSGWHVPSDDEWKTMEAFLGMTIDEVDKSGDRGVTQKVGGQLKKAGLESHWQYPNTAATNYSGFAAMPTGNRDGWVGWFNMSVGTYGYYWTMTDTTTFRQLVYLRILGYDNSGIWRGFGIPEDGFSVRCIRD